MAYITLSIDSSSSNEETPSPTRSPGCKRRRAARGRGRAAQSRGRGRGAGRLRSRGDGARGGRGRGQGGHSQNVHDQSPWSSVTTAVNVEPFIRSVGPAVASSACILELFKLFFTPALIDLIVEQRNLYASQTMKDEQHTKWEDVTAEEIWAYMEFMILWESITYRRCPITEIGSHVSVWSHC